jgi:Domain of unknown function (DUF1772)
VDAYMIVFRIVHIASAILWFGAAVFYSAFVGPALGSAGAEGSRLFIHLVRRGKAVIFFLVVSTSTVVAGAFLYWRDSGGLDIDWIQTGFGAGLTVGAVAGLISWFLVMLVLAPTSYRLTALGERMSATEEPPSPEQLDTVRGLQSRLNGFSLINIASLAVATLAMATARYLDL